MVLKKTKNMQVITERVSHRNKRIEVMQQVKHSK